MDLSTETLDTQFQTVKKLTDDSHVMEYGQVSLASQVVGQFQGMKKTPAQPLPKMPKDTVDARDVPIMVLKNRLMSENDESKKEALTAELKIILEKRHLVDSIVDRIVSNVAVEANVAHNTLTKSALSLHNLECHDKVAKAFHNICFDLSRNSYAMKYVRYFSNMCELGLQADKIIAQMQSACVVSINDAI